MQAGDAESAAILTPYNGQVRLIRRILKEHTGELCSKVCQSLNPDDNLCLLWIHPLCCLVGNPKHAICQSTL